MIPCAKGLCFGAVLIRYVVMKLCKNLPASYMNCSRMYLPIGGGLSPKRLLSALSVHRAGNWIFNTCSPNTISHTVPQSNITLGFLSKCYSNLRTTGWLHNELFLSRCTLAKCQSPISIKGTLLHRHTHWNVSFNHHRVTESSLSSVAPAFVVMKFDKDGNVTSFEKKKTELCQELSLQARDLRFQHSTSLTTRHNCIIIHMEYLKAVVTPQCLLVLDFRGLGLERWLVLELAPQLSAQAHTLPFEFRALEAILQHRVNTLQARLHEVHPIILDTLESLVDPKLLSADRSKLHVLLQNSKSLSELETDIKVFKESLLKILDEEEMIEELCLTKWTDPRVFEESSMGIDHAEEMELLLENYYMQAEELGNETRELKVLIDDSESIIFINLDSHRNVMMRLNLQLTMGTFSLSLFGLMGVAFGMNLESSFEEDPRVFWLVTGFMFLGSGLIWRRLLSFLGRHLEPSGPPPISPVWKRNLKAPDAKTGVR